MIQFELTYSGCRIVEVFLDKKNVGHIDRVEGGYQYFPKGCKDGGEIFKTLKECKQSLLED